MKELRGLILFISWSFCLSNSFNGEMVWLGSSGDLGGTNRDPCLSVLLESHVHVSISSSSWEERKLFKVDSEDPLEKRESGYLFSILACRFLGLPVCGLQQLDMTENEFHFTYFTGPVWYTCMNQHWISTSDFNIYLSNDNIYLALILLIL